MEGKYKSATHEECNNVFKKAIDVISNVNIYNKVDGVSEANISFTEEASPLVEKINDENINNLYSKMVDSFDKIVLLLKNANDLSEQYLLGSIDRIKMKEDYNEKGASGFPKIDKAFKTISKYAVNLKKVKQSCLKDITDIMEKEFTYKPTYTPYVKQPEVEVIEDKIEETPEPGLDMESDNSIKVTYEKPVDIEEQDDTNETVKPVIKWFN